MSNLERLQEAKSLRDIARLLRVRPKELAYLIHELPDNRKYTRFEIPKKSGGVRAITAPTHRLKKIQRRLSTILSDSHEEIELAHPRGSLSHGFRRHHSIVSNAISHRNRRYVLNLDLENFFPSINFGRVRGFFIKNKSFALHEDAATVIAQIACFQNKLPQGSPCSPIISEFIAHLLDVRLVDIAKRNGCTYSRYVDDITFSTNQKNFPTEIARPVSGSQADWVIGKAVASKIEITGFLINSDKTRMQYRQNRQTVTGLVVNEKVNVRTEYYRKARSMCHSVFRSGVYFVDRVDVEKGKDGGEQKNLTRNLNPLLGIMSHIHYVRRHSVNDEKKTEEKQAPSFIKLYRKLLYYRYFVDFEAPLVLCEGKTDKIYLDLAIKRLGEAYPNLCMKTQKGIRSKLSYFRYGSEAGRLLGIRGGGGDLKTFVARYESYSQQYKNSPQKNPVIIIIDNDSGSKDMFKYLNAEYSMSISLKSEDDYYHICRNLYVVKIPSDGKGTSKCIEDLFDPKVFSELVNGNKYNPKKEHQSDGEYGKAKFAEEVIQKNINGIDFKNFVPLLDRVSRVIEAHQEV